MADTELFMQQKQINLEQIDENLEGGELAEEIYYNCTFCEKYVGLEPEARKLCEKLSGNKFFCTFCLQNNLHTKSNRSILPVSFRGIIAYYHHMLYLGQKKIYFSEIEDYIKAHKQVGLANPVFRYDDESFMWFIDFNKVGKGKKKISIVEIQKTIVNILACFNLTTNADGIKLSKLFEKYNDAIGKFYSQRYRPPNKKILSPTLMGCGGSVDNKTSDFEFYKTFSKKNLYLR